MYNKIITRLGFCDIRKKRSLSIAYIVVFWAFALMVHFYLQMHSRYGREFQGNNLPYSLPLGTFLPLSKNLYVMLRFLLCNHHQQNNLGLARTCER